MTRRDFIKMLTAVGAAGLILPRQGYAGPDMLSDLYDLPPFGQVTLMHMTDCHAQLMPAYFREPSINIGLGEASGRLPHIVGTSCSSIGASSHAVLTRMHFPTWSSRSWRACMEKSAALRILPRS